MNKFTEFPSNKTHLMYHKKPIPISAVQIDEEFEVETMEGIMRGKPGDYLMRGIRGEIYPCDKGIFEESYERCEFPPF